MRERFDVSVDAPASVVMQVAENFDIASIPIVRAIFWMRAKMLRSKEVYRGGSGLVASMLSIGWGRLSYSPGRELVMGGRTQPWESDPEFVAIDPAEFAAWCEPGFVKIAWTLEATPLGESRSILASETRAIATDLETRRRFKRYWRLVRVGVVTIRWFALPAVRREAERRTRISNL